MVFPYFLCVCDLCISDQNEIVSNDENGVNDKVGQSKLQADIIFSFVLSPSEAAVLWKRHECFSARHQPPVTLLFLFTLQLLLGPCVLPNADDPPARLSSGGLGNAESHCMGLSCTPPMFSPSSCHVQT